MSSSAASADDVDADADEDDEVEEVELLEDDGEDDWIPALERELEEFEFESPPADPGHPPPD